MKHVILAMFVVTFCASLVDGQASRTAIPYLGIAFRWQQDRNTDKVLHVERVSPNSPAQVAGVQPGDIIMRIQDVPVGFGDELDFLVFMSERKVGEQVSLDLIRAGAKRRVVVRLGELPAAQRSTWERGLTIAKQRRLAGVTVH